MPIYDYECSDCKSEFDMFTTFENRNNVKCPNCGSSRIRILVSKLGYLKHPTQVTESTTSTNK